MENIEMILKQAKEKFPIGSKVICSYDELPYTITSYDCDNDIDEYDDIWFLSGAIGVRVYKKGKWADIVK